jgi:acylphosphatase
MPVKQYLVRGIVQGVGFRFFVRQEARGLGLTGYVRNLADGSVEAVAVGDPARLAEFERVLRRGPPASRVDSVAVRDTDGEGPFDSFAIRHA